MRFLKGLSLTGSVVKAIPVALGLLGGSILVYFFKDKLIGLFDRNSTPEEPEV